MNECRAIDTDIEGSGQGLLLVARRHNANMIMTSSQDDAILIGFGASYIVEGCRLKSRARNMSKNKGKTMKRRLKTTKMEKTTNDSSRTKRQSIIVEAKLKIIRNV